MTEIKYVDESTVEVVHHVGNDDMVAHAAWVSNFSRDDTPKRPYYFHTEKVEEWEKRIGGLINFLYRERHMSPFEHGSMTFYIDTPIFVAREFMRHRTFSYNETSGRYKELEPRFYLPGTKRPMQQQGKVGNYTFSPGTPNQYGLVWAEFEIANKQSWESYQSMLGEGVAREVARDVLPLNIMTQFYATANVRNIMQFLTLRNDEHALYEIREVAIQIETAFAAQFPLTYAAYKKYDWRDEKTELNELRAKVAQMEAYETYAKNIEAGSRISV